MKKSYLTLILMVVLGVSHAQLVEPPAGIKVDLQGKIMHPRYDAEAPAVSLVGREAEDNLYIFPCCTNSQFFVGIELSYFDDDFSTPTTDWTYELTFELYLSGVQQWSHSLEVNMDEQQVLSLIFHDQSTYIDASSSYIKITEISKGGEVPEEHLFVKARLYQVRDQPLDIVRDLDITATTDAYATTVTFTEMLPDGETLDDEIIEEYELEWVFIEEGYSVVDGADAFAKKAGTRISTSNDFFILDQLFPPGRLYFRARRVGYLPDDPTHKRYGNWEYAEDVVTNFNTNETSNWQQTVTYAEEGKNKKVLSFYDGTLRPVQTLTNLNTADKTLIAEPAYDFEGRKVVDFLPFAIPGWSPVEGRWNQFSSKTRYDNFVAVDLEPELYESDLYYEGHEDPYVPRSDGYAYAQTRYHNDATGRVVKQSGVGAEFKMDGERNTRYHYGTATRTELIRLFGPENIGDPNHYRKNLVQDPNGQVSVTYLDPQGRTIATALAGEAPENVQGLQSFTSLPAEVLGFDLSKQYTLDDGVKTTHHTLLNVALGTDYTFSYSAEVTDDLLNLEGLPATPIPCTYDVSVRLVDPNGAVFSIYEEPNLSSSSCGGAPCTTVYPMELSEIGEYTLIKEVRPNELSYQEVRTYVESLTTTQEKQQQYEAEISVDASLCTISNEELSLDEIGVLAKEVAEQTCNSIREEMIRDLISDANGISSRGQAEQNLASHPRYCEYTFCIETTESEAFDTKLYAINDYQEADDLGLTDPAALLEADPLFFEGAVGEGRSQQMLNMINAYTLTFQDLVSDPCITPQTSYTGSIDDLVDFGNAGMQVNNTCDGQNYHILYYEEQQKGAAANSDVIDELKWRFQRSFYLDAKRDIKLLIANTAPVCSPLEQKLNDQRIGLEVEDDINGFVLSSGLDYRTHEISDFSLNQVYEELVSSCTGDPISAADKATIIERLRTFYNSNKDNLSLSISVNQFDAVPLSDVKAILLESNYGCNLEVITSKLPFVNLNSRSCDGCNPYFYKISDMIAEYQALCLSYQQTIREDKIRILMEEYVEEQISEFYQNYSCTASIDERFSYSYSPKEYHYTLYYYDRADNLVMTVPPAGVDLTDHGNSHSLQTTYHYNSLNQLVEQTSPDGGTTQFRYDSKGQLRLSQNAKQAAHVPPQVSYTRYDQQGRIMEVGELNTPGGSSFELLAAVENLDEGTFPSSQDYSLEEITKTVYDFPTVADLGTFHQENLRGRVSYVTLFEDPSTPSVATYYSYDSHGNVKSLLQDINEPGITPKRIDYAYDLISGNVNYVIFEHGNEDQFYHRYSYDADNRIVQVETSVDGVIWNNEARYSYHDHGPLSRLELGAGQNLQGLDYFYTLQGWLKGVNIPRPPEPLLPEDPDFNFGKDLVAFNLGYYDGDFTPGPGGLDLDSRDQLWTQYANNSLDGNTGLYNGNIAWMNTWLSPIAGQIDKPSGMQAMLYRYDQLNRIKGAQGLTDFDPALGYGSPQGHYDTEYGYDPNGNLMQLQRNDDGGASADNLNYDYYPETNQLYATDGTESVVNLTRALVDAGAGDVYAGLTADGSAALTSADNVAVEATHSIELLPGFQSQGATFSANISEEAAVGAAYRYDPLGNLEEDLEQGTSIDWTVYGKVDQVAGASGDGTDYTYDPAGNRVVKAQTLGGSTTHTYYIRDASGNLMAIYDDNGIKERPIYGSSRLGFFGGGNFDGLKLLGQRRYEISNHLGNVLTTFSDELKVNQFGVREMVATSTSSYYPFGKRSQSWAVDSDTFEKTVVVGTTTEWETRDEIQTVFNTDFSTVPAEFTGSNAPTNFSAAGTLNLVDTAPPSGGSSGSGSQAYCPVCEENDDPTIQRGFANFQFATEAGVEYTLSFTLKGKGLVADPNAPSDAIQVTTGSVTSAYFEELTDDDRQVTFSFTPTSTLTTVTLRNGYLGTSTTHLVVTVVDDMTLERTVTITELVTRDVENTITVNLGGYRYGFNGKEKDDNGEFGSTVYDYGFRIYDPRIAKFLSVDPLTKEYPWYTPYQFAGNTPIQAIDLDGLEEYHFTLTQVDGQWDLDFSHMSNQYSIDTKPGFFGFLEIGNSIPDGEAYYAIHYHDSFWGTMTWRSDSDNWPILFQNALGGPNSLGISDEQKREAFMNAVNSYSQTMTPIKAMSPSFHRNRKSPKALIAPARKSERVANLPSHLQRRVKLRTSTKNEIMKNARVTKDSEGNLRWVDAVTLKPIPGDRKTFDPSRGKDVYGDFHFGHKKDRSWKDYQDDPDNWVKTRSQVNDDQNNPSNYQIEWHHNNESNGAKGNL